MRPNRFTQFAAIDWSGQAVARPKGLALAVAKSGQTAPCLIGPKIAWSRQDIADWIIDRAQDNILIGLDLSTAFPFIDQQAYFPGWHASPDFAPPNNARALWHLVESIAADDPDLSASSFVSHAEASRHFRQSSGLGDLHPPGRGRLRVCEHGQKEAGLSPYSCFNLIGAAQVGKSSLTGMRVLNQISGRVAIWPFDPIPETGAVVVEIYTTLAARAAGVPKGLSKLRSPETLDAALAALGSKAHTKLHRYDDHATDALVTAAWLRVAAHDERLWQPRGMTRAIAQTEGWTFGVA